MSKTVIIGIGGTGARCLEAIVHLSAIGIGPDNIELMAIDTDASNGNLEKLKKVIALYQKCKNLIGNEENIFRTYITVQQSALGWAPADVSPGMSLAKYFSYNSLKHDNPTLSKVCNLLFSKDELRVKWDRGFRGRASIGAPVMASLAYNLDNDPWPKIINTIEEEISKHNEARVFIAASIFGATGASAFPIIPRVLKEYFNKNKDSLLIGGAMILPYFSFGMPTEDTFAASPKDFHSKTKAVLSHYSHDWKYTGCPYDSIYLIGERELDLNEGEETRSFADGGPEQNNYAHYIELLAALAFNDFRTRDKDNILKFSAVARGRENLIEWQDLPFSNELEKRTLSFTTMALSFKSFYLPLFSNPEFLNNDYLAPWYADLKKKLGKEVESEENELDTFDEYLEEYLNWIYELLSSTHRELKLVNTNAIKLAKNNNWKLNDEHFSSLHASKTPKIELGYDALWDELCNQDIDIKKGPITLTGKFLSMLNEASKNFCERNYSL